MPLIVCATPIGNLEDVTLRVLHELAAADVVLCEDTRRTRILLDRHGVQATLVSFERHSEARRTVEMLPLLEDGKRVALVSDAGLPAVNDPGKRLIVAARERGLPVVVLPGPSAVETALVASGLVAERYLFLGFLPRGEAALGALWEELLAWPWPAVAFESPRRLPRTLTVLASFDHERPLAVCRELTKRYEEVVTGSAAELADRFREGVRGEITLVLGPSGTAQSAVAEKDAIAAVNELVEAGVPRRGAARVIGRLVGLAPNRLYRGSL
jgi:16S rRNA (cytidine1402-2'-O)-methyltransferase